MWAYQSAFNDREELLKIIEKSKISEKVKLALHSAADFYKCKNTNLSTLVDRFKSSSI
ncbi:MAG: hypothetical protein ChlgKO_14870 [Chlamydiales bacterium]